MKTFATAVARHGIQFNSSFQADTLIVSIHVFARGRVKIATGFSFAFIDVYE